MHILACESMHSWCVFLDQMRCLHSQVKIAPSPPQTENTAPLYPHCGLLGSARARHERTSEEFMLYSTPCTPCRARLGRCSLSDGVFSACVTSYRQLPSSLNNRHTHSNCSPYTPQSLTSGWLYLNHNQEATNFPITLASTCWVLCNATVLFLSVSITADHQQIWVNAATVQFPP